MTHYCLYFLDSENSIADPVDVECDTHEQAIAVAQEKADGRRIEIWQRTGRVWVSEASGAAISS
ncbi:MAG: hypothetical protein ACJ8AW_25745 [Rhodopila sp.]